MEDIDIVVWISFEDFVSRLNTYNQSIEYSDDQVSFLLFDQSERDVVSIIDNAVLRAINAIDELLVLPHKRIHPNILSGLRVRANQNVLITVSPFFVGIFVSRAGFSNSFCLVSSNQQVWEGFRDTVFRRKGIKSEKT
ncbi:MAG: hypothetical protein NZO16_04780 [Deltaproteobacteria bacterium]|nr:hypothetical protein [Deltaproteobacteria bacterium]